jgi:hypothetical protein
MIARLEPSPSVRYSVRVHGAKPKTSSPRSCSAGGIPQFHVGIHRQSKICRPPYPSCTRTTTPALPLPRAVPREAYGRCGDWELASPARKARQAVISGHQTAGSNGALQRKKRPCLRVAGVPAPVRCSSPDAGVPIRGGPPIDVRAPRGVVPARRGPGACDWVGMGMGMGSRPARGGKERVGSPRAGVRGVWWRMRS